MVQQRGRLESCPGDHGARTQDRHGHDKGGGGSQTGDRQPRENRCHQQAGHQCTFIDVENAVFKLPDAVPGRVLEGNRVTLAISVRIDPACPERAQGVRAVKAHQGRVVGSVTLAQQVPAAGLIADFTVKSQQALQLAIVIVVAAAFALSAVDRCAQFGVLVFAKHTVAGVGQQQQGLCVVVHLLLTQRCISIVEVLDLRIPLNRVAQAIALIEAQHLDGRALCG